MSLSKIIISFALFLTTGLALSQQLPLDKTGAEKISFNAHTCTGWFGSPNWKCEALTLPGYLYRAKDNKALVLISHGSQGEDVRHSRYAKQLVANGINALVIGHWEARGLSMVQQDYDGGRKKGGDGVNQTLDVLAVGSQLQAMPEWADTNFGHMGESLGGTTALNLTRPWLRRIHVSLYGSQPLQFTALAALYSGCAELNVNESFLPYPILFINGTADNLTLAENCQRQVPWMNSRGGRSEIVLLEGEYHGFDNNQRLGNWPSENPAKCASTQSPAGFTLEATGKQYPPTTEGFAQLKKDCIRLTPRYSMAGNRGDPKTGFKEWIEWFKKTLLNEG
jgi:dienelactone hydrolase